jgi:hypothetical protein
MSREIIDQPEKILDLESAAGMLRLASGTLMKKLDAGEIEYQGTLSAPRIALQELEAYRAKQRNQARLALQQMRDEEDELRQSES